MLSSMIRFAFPNFSQRRSHLSSPLHLAWLIQPKLAKYAPICRSTCFPACEDPVGEELEGVKVLIDGYRKASISDISYDFYPGGRHEMLNEINRVEVVANLLGWISGVLQRVDEVPIAPSAT